MFLEKLVLGIGLAMAEEKSVILAGDYNLNYFAKRDRSLLQSVISPYDLKPTNNNTATRMTTSSSTLIDYIITDDYETGIVADTILKTDQFATIAVLKSVMLKSKTTKKKFFDKKNYSAIAFQNFIENSDWRHFYSAVTGDMMLLEFQRIIERALALHAPIKACYIRTDKPKFLLQEKWLCEETKRQFSRISEDETKNDLIRQKEKQLLSSFMELNSEKARWKLIQDLRNKEKTQARIQSLLNSYGDKITKPMEIANLNYRFSTLGEFIALQQTNHILPKTAPRNCCNFRCITTKETNVLIDSLNTSKPVGPSKIPAWAIKDAKAALAEPLCYLINQFITEGKFPEDLKKACVTPLFKKRESRRPTQLQTYFCHFCFVKNF